MKKLMIVFACVLAISLAGVYSATAADPATAPQGPAVKKDKDGSRLVTRPDLWFTEVSDKDSKTKQKPESKPNK